MGKCVHRDYSNSNIYLKPVWVRGCLLSIKNAGFVNESNQNNNIYSYIHEQKEKCMLSILSVMVSFGFVYYLA